MTQGSENQSLALQTLQRSYSEQTASACSTILPHQTKKGVQNLRAMSEIWM